MGEQESQVKLFPRLSDGRVVLRGDEGKWDANKVHTLSVVQANLDGFKFWGYYGLCNYGGSPDVRQAGLARSNDLLNWEKYDGNPIIEKDCRWPTVVLVDSVFYMFYAEYDDNNDSQIVMRSSRDGIEFGDKTVIVPRERFWQNQNPFVFFNKQDSHFYLAYYSGIEISNDKPLIGRDHIVRKEAPREVKNIWQIKLRKSGDVRGLKDAPSKILMEADFTVASPSISFFKGRYWLLVEAIGEGKWGNKWVTKAYVSNAVDGPYSEVDGNPILPDNDTCAFQHVFDGKFYITYSHCLDISNWNWDLRVAMSAD